MKENKLHFLNDEQFALCIDELLSGTPLDEVKKDLNLKNLGDDDLESLRLFAESLTQISSVNNAITPPSLLLERIVAQMPVAQDQIITPAHLSQGIPSPFEQWYKNIPMVLGYGTPLAVIAIMLIVLPKTENIAVEQPLAVEQSIEISDVALRNADVGPEIALSKGANMGNTNTEASLATEATFAMMSMDSAGVVPHIPEDVTGVISLLTSEAEIDVAMLNELDNALLTTDPLLIEELKQGYDETVI